MNPNSLKFAKTHEWVHLEGEIATVGISDFAVNQLTDLVYIELPEVGKSLNAGDVFGEVESVKAVSDLYAPLSGEIAEVNQLLEDELSLLSDSPFEQGWIIKIKVSDPAGLESLLNKSAYDEHCQEDH